MTHLVENPPWVNKALTSNWQFIADSIPAPYLPRMTVTRAGNRKVAAEYGCGHYGCVMATEDPDSQIVVKVTSDPSEAEFVTTAWARLAGPEPLDAGREGWMKSWTDWPNGIVRYFQIIELEASYRNRPVWILWRDEAYDVGDSWRLSHSANLDHYEKREISQSMWRLDQFKVNAHYVREKLKKRPEWREEAVRLWQAQRNRRTQLYETAVELILEEKRQYGQWQPGFGRITYLRGAERLAAHLVACEIAAELMGAEPAFYEVGQALEAFLDKGMLLADVHANNIGRTEEDRKSALGQWVITDPGHLVLLW